MTQTVKDLLNEIEDVSAIPLELISDVARRTIPRWHFTMLNDHERSAAFAAALERRVKPGAHVLDIGSGTGLLAMMAAAAGAYRVTTCEANPLLAEIATQVIAAHGLSDVITLIPKRSTDLVVGRDFDEPVDLIVAEIVDCGLVGEGLLPTMRHARQHLLAPGGQVMPESARLFGLLVEGQALAGLNSAHDVAGYDVGLINMARTRGHFPVRLRTWPHRVLSDTAELAGFQILTDTLADDQRPVSLPVKADGHAHALVLWFELDLGAGVAIRNSPENLGSHWMQALIPFDHPVRVTAGSTLDVTIRWHDNVLNVSL